MKTLTMLLTMVAAIVLLPAWSAADEAAEKEQTTKPKECKPCEEPTTRKKPPLRGMHAQMAKVCKMSEQQQEQIAELNALRQEAMKQFQNENAEKVETLKAQLAEAKKNTDKEAMKEAGEQLRNLRIKQNEIYTQWQAKIMAVLTPEQKLLWDRYQVMLTIKRLFRNVELTDEQTAKAEAECVKLTTGVDLSDRNTRAEAIKKLAEHVRQEILTDAQREAATRPAQKPTTMPKDSAEPSKVEKVEGEKVVNDK